MMVSKNFTSANPRVHWFEDARFGLFIHFGLYSIPAGVWNGKRMGRNDYAEWIRYQLYWPEPGPIPKEEYDTLLAQFNPTKFDADDWMRQARDAGMRYLVVTTKHHDGFALWDSEVSPYNGVKATPFGRDIIAELTAACRRYGLKVGFYYSHWQDWEFPGGGLPVWEKDQPGEQAIDHYWQTKCLPQVRELIERFSPDLFWFDSWGNECKLYLTGERLGELMTLIRELAPQCLINSRIGTEQGVDYLSTDDNHFPEKNLGAPWETSGTFNESWGYHQLDQAWKDPAQLVRNLASNASRGGNYQLNVGPTGEGVFQSAASERLSAMGEWMQVHGEAIYGTRPAPYPEPSWGRLTQKITGSGGVELYAFIFAAASGRCLLIEDVHQAPREAGLLGGGTIAFEKTAEGLEFKLPEKSGAGLLPVVRFCF